MTQPIAFAQLDIGRVISRTFAAIAANFLAFFILSVLVVGVPTILVDYFTDQMILPGLAESTDPGSMPMMVNLVRLGATVILWLPSYVLMGALAHGSIVYLNGGRATLVECLGTGLSRSLPLLALGLLTTLGVMLFAILLIVPGVMAATRWAVAAPALVAERTGVFGAFSRSGELTRDNRWRIFWLFVICVIAIYLVQLGVTSSMGFVFQAIGPNSGPLLYWVIYGIVLLISSLTNLLGAVGASALYCELRVAKEGATSDELAKVFE